MARDSMWVKDPRPPRNALSKTRKVDAYVKAQVDPFVVVPSSTDVERGRAGWFADIGMGGGYLTLRHGVKSKGALATSAPNLRIVSGLDARFGVSDIMDVGIAVEHGLQPFTGYTPGSEASDDQTHIELTGIVFTELHAPTVHEPGLGAGAPAWLWTPRAIE